MGEQGREGASMISTPTPSLGRDPSIYGPDLNSISFGLHELGNPTEWYFYIKQNTPLAQSFADLFFFREVNRLFHIIYLSVPTCAAFCPTSKQWIIKRDNIIVPIPIVRVGLLPKKRCGIESWTDRPGGDFLAAD